MKVFAFSVLGMPWTLCLLAPEDPPTHLQNLLMTKFPLSGTGASPWREVVGLTGPYSQALYHGMCFTNARVIVVRTDAPSWVFMHELGHAFAHYMLSDHSEAAANLFASAFASANEADEVYKKATSSLAEGG